MKSEIRKILESVAKQISLRNLSIEYFNREPSWFYHKLHEDVINGIKYQFSESEIDVLCDGLKSISYNLSIAVQELQSYKRRRQRARGWFPTENNPFNHPLFFKWFGQVNQKCVLIEPFFGNGSIPRFLNQLGISNKWKCYDIEQVYDVCNYKVIRKDVLKNFPQGYKCCITNPPFLAKNAAKRLGLSYPNTRHNDIYKLSLELMLTNCDYVATILPASFLTTPYFKERLNGVILLDEQISKGTDFPVCLALFNSEPQQNFVIYQGNEFVGTNKELQNYLIEEVPVENGWQFNDPDGNIGVICFDLTEGETIRFVMGETIDRNLIKSSSRSATRVKGLPDNVEVEKFIEVCNRILFEYRATTYDVFLTPFKGIRKDGRYRRRIDFKTIRKIMNKALYEISNNHK